VNFSLRQDVYCCNANNRFVFLDLRKDRYFCLPKRAEDAFQSALDSASEIDLEALRPLMSAGALVRTESPARLLLLTSSEPASTSLPRAQSLQTSPLHLALALHSHLEAGLALKFFPLKKVVADIRFRSAHHGSAQRAAIDLSELVAGFSATKRLIPAKDQCLSYAIALIFYLRHFRLYPNLVLGVRMNPFAAHAWVQSDGVVLNDDLETVRLYTPILTA
jgi:hypothetical protein